MFWIISDTPLVVNKTAAGTSQLKCASLFVKELLKKYIGTYSEQLNFAFFFCIVKDKAPFEIPSLYYGALEKR